MIDGRTRQGARWRMDERRTCWSITQHLLADAVIGEAKERWMMCRVRLAHAANVR